MNTITPSCSRCLRPISRAFVYPARGSVRSNCSAAGDGAAVAGGSDGKRKKKERMRYQRTVFSGIQPTGIPHLGNYLGALRNWKHLQSPTLLPPSPTSQHIDPTLPLRTLFFIPSLHAITLPQDPAFLKRARMECLASLLACGIGGEGEDRATLFFQEDLGGLHTELAWVLGTLCGVGRLERMTSWKSKISIAQGSSDSSDAMNDLKLGLLSYPVLQAADILLYKATDIPVGEDQKQHLELARDLAEMFNKRFGETFPLPHPLITPAKRILSLTDPSQKMSKSAPNPLSRILITDPPNVITKKIRSAVTDTNRLITWDPIERRGVSNLLTILAACSGSPESEVRDLSAEELAESLSSIGVSGHAQLKNLVADAVVEELRGVREEYGRILAEEGYLREEGRRGKEKAGMVAGGVMREVREKVGLGSI